MEKIFLKKWLRIEDECKNMEEAERMLASAKKLPDSYKDCRIVFLEEVKNPPTKIDETHGNT